MINEIQTLVSEREWRIQWVINSKTKKKLESKQKAADSCKTVFSNRKLSKRWAARQRNTKTKHTFPNSKNKQKKTTVKHNYTVYARLFNDDTRQKRKQIVKSRL